MRDGETFVGQIEYVRGKLAAARHLLKRADKVLRSVVFNTEYVMTLDDLKRNASWMRDAIAIMNATFANDGIYTLQNLLKELDPKPVTDGEEDEDEEASK